MKIYFYGATEKAVEKKCETFIKNLKKNAPVGTKIGITHKCTIASIKDVCLPKGYTVQAYIAYNKVI